MIFFLGNLHRKIPKIFQHEHSVIWQVFVSMTTQWFDKIFNFSVISLVASPLVIWLICTCASVKALQKLSPSRKAKRLPLSLFHNWFIPVCIISFMFFLHYMTSIHLHSRMLQREGLCFQCWVYCFSASGLGVLVTTSDSDLISKVIEHHALGLVLKVTTTRLYKPCPVWIISTIKAKLIFYTKFVHWQKKILWENCVSRIDFTKNSSLLVDPILHN